MNKLFIGCLHSLFISHTYAAILRVDVQGQLGDEVLALHSGYQDAPFSGFFEFDLANRQTSGSGPFYEMTNWRITITGTSGSLLQESSGEPHDAGEVFLGTGTDRITITIDEDIDDTPNEGSTIDRTLRLVFDPQFDIVSTTTYEDLLANNPNFQFISESSLLQFSTSQAPMVVASASLSAVPAPAALWLFGSACLGLTGYRRWLTSCA